MQSFKKHTVKRHVFCSLFILQSVFSYAQSPIQKELETYIDPFTGDFTYQLPLISISGPNGESFPVVLNYSGGGIQMNDEGSWVGLGWSLPIGEIQRNVNGVSDDYKGKKYSKYSYENNNATATKIDSASTYGPVYFKNYSHASADNMMDLYQSDRFAQPGETPFEFPDYDDYYVSGPGIGGKMSMAMLEYASLLHPGSEYGDGNGYTSVAFTRTPQFYFENEPATQVKAPYYSQTFYTPGVGYPNGFAYLDLPGCNTLGGCDQYLQSPDDLSGTTSITEPDYYGDYVSSKNARKGVNYIEYFTNQQIYDYYVSSSGITNFIDHTGGLTYTNCNRDNAGYYDADGIGAIRITAPNGLTYHYSLPVYAYDEIDREFNLDESFDIITDQYNRASRPDKSAVTWKLVAITGPDYVDANTNHFPDDGDSGYWVALNYSKWTDDFFWRAPYVGYYFNLSADRFPKKFQYQMQDEPYERKGSVSEGHSELYYINWIKTSTQTLYFVKDVRLDAHSVKNSSGYATPKLCLKKLILMDNNDITSSWFETSTTDLSSSDFSGLSSTTNDRKTVNWTQYSNNKTAIDAASLKSVELTFDYSLCKKVYNNIKNSVSTTAVQQSYVISSTTYYRFLADDITGSVSTSDYATSGKLTLTEVKTREYQHADIIPSYQFTYANSPSDNPDYNHEKKDYFGYYKSNFDVDVKGGYITDQDESSVDAWLLNVIKLPIGGEINIEYESDIYEGVLYDNSSSKPSPVTRTFRLTDVGGSTSPVISVEDQDLYYLTNGNITNGSIYYLGNSTDYNFANGTLSATIQSASTTNYTLGSGYSSAVLACTNCVGDGFPSSTAYISVMLPTAYGGGARVKSISVKEPVANEEYSISVDYDEGLATAEPDPFGPIGINLNTFTGNHPAYELRATKYSGDRHALAPTVGYSNVKYKYIGTGGNNGGSKEYNLINYFSTFSRVGTDGEFYYNLSGGDFDTYYFWETIRIEENKSLFGRLKYENIYDKFGNIVSKTEYVYSSKIIDEEPKLEEVFYRQYATSADIDANPGDVEGIIIRSVFYKIKSSSFLKEKIVYLDGVKSTSEIQERDALTGAPTQIEESNNSTPNSVSVFYHAYHNNSGMGSKYDNAAYKNLLTPPMVQKSKRSGYLVGGAYSLWSDSHDIWTYNNTNGRFERTNTTTQWAPVVNYSFNGDSDSSQWQLSGRSTLLGSRNQPLEVKDWNDYYSATKYGYNDRYAIASGKNTNYSSFTHTSFEYTTSVGSGGGAKAFFDGEVYIGGGTKDDGASAGITPHTGNYLLKLTSGAADVTYGVEYNNTTIGSEVIEKGIQAGRTYRASVWVHTSSPNFAKLQIAYDDGSSVYTESITKLNANGITIGNWTLMYVDITVPSGFTGNGSNADDFQVSLINPGGYTTAYFDDLRVQPVDADVNAQVLDEKRGLVLYSINKDNYYTRYVYDAAGSVIEVYQETDLGEKKISSHAFHFARQ